ncbi:hypothetical protein [Paraburkholderia sp. J63]|uniref:hypothetical protein n=1 Tax=Paraburkholderia sp. J63 TaxID=2805434 RepID=UPI002ABE5918|nr:hypothetical protein [Paraburkholderia sp. J63]
MLFGCIGSGPDIVQPRAGRCRHRCAASARGAIEGPARCGNAAGSPNRQAHQASQASKAGDAQPASARQAPDINLARISRSIASYVSERGLREATHAAPDPLQPTAADRNKSQQIAANRSRTQPIRSTDKHVTEFVTDLTDG